MIFLKKLFKKREYREISGYRIPMLPAIENGLVLLGHINQHLKDFNLGLRQIIDWEMYVNKALDQKVWSKSFVPLADKLGLKELAVNVTNMCVQYLGLTNSCNITSDLKVDTSNELINVLFETGNFSCKKNQSVKKNIESSISSGLYSIKKKGFFSYIQDLGLQRWKTCQKHPILKPFAWIYGLFRAIVKGLIILFRGGSLKKSLNDAKQKVTLSKKLGLKSK